jgi:hypothetical protein
MEELTTTPVMQLVTSQDVQGVLAPAAFNAVALREQLPYVRRAHFPAGSLAVDDVLPLGDVELVERMQSGAGAVLLRLEPRMVASIWIARGNADLAVAGADEDDVGRVTEDLVASLRDEADAGTTVPITFWAHSPGMALNPRRRVHAPHWRDIRTNYAGDTRAALDELMAATEPGPGGLLLWHGEPGTGKSYALRALVREWLPWCETHFITDPEAFLGSKPGYLLNLLLRSESRRSEDPPWRLIVLEDAGELLRADARALAGQGLSRLLNVADGLIGEGLRAIFIVTTNEPLGRLHDAVARPGRCWAQVEFKPMSAGDSHAWLEARGVHAATERATLAELFALADGRAVPQRRSLGFGAP